MENVIKLIEQSIERKPHAVSIECGERVITYARLDELVNRLAAYLLQRKRREEEAVCVYLNNSLEAIVSCVAVLKAGMAFVPIMYTTPPERLKFIVEETQSTTIISSREHATNLKTAFQNCVVMEVDDLLEKEGPATGPAVEFPKVKSSDLAYIIYTSGSTGEPKGVMVEHGSLLSKCAVWERAYGVSKGFRHLQMARISFDVFVGDMLRSLCFGGALIVCPYYTILDPEKLFHFIQSKRISFFETVPSVFRTLHAYLLESGQSLAHVDTVVISSDHWSVDEYANFKITSQVRRLINCYGITEVSIDSTFFEASPETIRQYKHLPLGSSFGGDKILLLDDSLSPAEVGVQGEIFITGRGLFRGYLNRPDLTQKALVEIRSDSGQFERAYKTGDYGVRNSDGLIEFIGRRDNQVRISGHRVELDEIDNLLRAYKCVKDSITIYSDSLTSYVQLFDKLAAFNKDDLFAYLRSKLPSYMIPSSIVVVDAIPLSENGKVNRKELMMGNDIKTPKIRKKVSHKLHLCKDKEQLVQHLASAGIDIVSVVYEFIKPTADVGILVGGSIVEGTATDVSDLDILVLIEDSSAIKNLKNTLSDGTTVFTVNGKSNKDLQMAILFISGIEINIEFYINEEVQNREGNDATNLDTSDIGETEQRFLSRLRSGWVIEGEDIVNSWKQFYDITRLRERIIVKELNFGLKLLEDMKAAIGTGAGHSAFIGSSIVGHLLRSILAHNNFLSPSVKWIKKVSYMIKHSDENTNALLLHGKALLFPTLLDSSSSETEYFNSVLGFAEKAERYIRQNESLCPMIDFIKKELDLIS